MTTTPAAPIAPPLPGTRQAPRDAFAEYVAELESDAEGIDALSAKEQEALGRSAVLQAIRGSGHRLPPGFDEDGAKAFPGIRSLPARGNEDATLRHTVVRDDSPSLEIRPRDAQTAQAEGADQPPVEATSLAPEEWEKIIGNILKREGLFNPRDPSMRGIKDTTLQEILRRRGEVPSPEEFDQRLRNLSEAEAREIYHIIREEAQLTRLPDAELAEQVFDGVVNQGQGDGIKQLQSALNKVTGSNLVVDGALGSRTQRAVGAAIASGRLRDVRRQIVEERIAKIDSLKDSESDKAVLRQRARDVGPR